MKNVIRKMTTWMLVFGMTFTPVLTGIDVVAANAEEGKTLIKVGEKEMNFTNDNLNDEAKQDVAGAATANAEAGKAEQAAATAEQAKATAETAATAAETAADDAADVAQAAADAAAKVGKADGAVQNAIIDASTAVGKAETSTGAAETAIGEANQAVTDAGDAVTTAEASIKKANDQVDAADAAIQTANETKATVQGLIDAAAERRAAIEEKIGNVAEERADIVNTIASVQQQVQDAESLFSKADEAAQTEVQKISKALTDALLSEDGPAAASEAAAGQVVAAMKNAKDEDNSAELALDDAKGALRGVKALVNNGSHDVKTAKKLAENAAAAADEAQQAADNAASYAEAARVAEGVAKIKLEEAQKAFDDALKALAEAQAAYDAAYGQANKNKDTVNGSVKAVNDRIADYNDDFVVTSYVYGTNIPNGYGHEELMKLVYQYNRDEVWDLEWLTGNKPVNNKIDAANTAIEGAQGEIDKIAGLDKKAKDDVKTAGDLKGTAEGKVSAADTAITQAATDKEAAQQAVNAAQEELNKTTKEYDNAVKAKGTVESLAQTAANKATEARNAAKTIADQAAITKVAAETTEDELARITNGKTYQNLVDEKAAADKEVDRLNGLYNAEYFAGQSKIVNDNYTALYGEDEKGGINKELNDAKNLKADYEKKPFLGQSKIEKAREDKEDAEAEIKAGGYTYYNLSYPYKHWHAYTEAELAQFRKTSQDAQAKIDEYEGLLGENGKIKTLQKRFDDAEEAMNAASEDIEQKRGLIKAAEDIRDEKATNLNKVEDFKYTDENTMVLTKSDLEKLLKAAYASYQEVDEDTTDYKGIHKNWWMLSRDGLNELGIEMKYEDILKQAWWQDYHLQMYDTQNEGLLEGETSRRCVIVCTDIDKMAVLRATYADALARQAEADAIAAAGRADTAKSNADTAKTNLITAANIIDGAQGTLDELQGTLNDMKVTGKLNTSEIKDLAYTTKQLQNTLAKKFTDADRLQEYDPELPERLDVENVSGVAGKEQALALIERLKQILALATAAKEKAEQVYQQALIDKKEAETEAACAAEDAKEARDFADQAEKLAKRIKPATGGNEEETTPASGSGSGEGDGSSVVPAIIPASTGPVLIPLTAGGTTPSGVAGVRVADADAGESEGEGAAAAAEAPAPAVEENTQEVLEDADLPAAAEPTTIEDDDLAGAQTVEEAASMWWIWLLVILAALAGFGVYKYVDNKKKKAGTIEK